MGMQRSSDVQQTITRVTATIRRPTLTVTDTPTIGQLQVWWEAMQSDDLSVAYADSFPPTLSDFRLGAAQGDRLFLLCLVDGQVAGALWLHDLLHRRDGSVSAGWIGCYFLSAYRGRLALDLWQTARQHWEAAGVVHFFSAANVANRRSQAFIARGAHFHRVGIFHDFSFFRRRPADMVIYTLHAEDTRLAWELATARAARQIPAIRS
jgi:RimJ/RimL family protein N-acetyltransferase